MRLFVANVPVRKAEEFELVAKCEHLPLDPTDTRVHVVAQGDTLEGLAGRYFAPLPRACGFWWVLADFQPDPIVDPTLELDVGRRLLVPSLRVLTDVILSEQRRRFDA
jgi:hypothetical protein